MGAQIFLYQFQGVGYFNFFDAFNPAWGTRLIQRIDNQFSELTKLKGGLTDVPPQAPSEIPRIIWQGENSPYHMRCNLQRVELFWHPAPDLNHDEAVASFSQLYSSFLTTVHEFAGIDVHRLGFVLTTFAALNEDRDLYFARTFNAVKTTTNLTDYKLFVAFVEKGDDYNLYRHYRLERMQEASVLGTDLPNPISVTIDFNTGTERNFRMELLESFIYKLNNSLLAEVHRFIRGEV